MPEPLPSTYGPANWVDWSDNWRKADGDFLQYRGILRYATDAGKPASGQPGQVIYTADNANLSMWTTKWVQVLSSENMKLVTSGAQARFTHPSAGGAGLLFSTGPNQITAEVDFKGGRVEADTLVVYTGAGNRTARLSTTAADLVSDSPILAPSITLNTGAANAGLHIPYGRLSVGGSASFSSTIVAGGNIQGNRLLCVAAQDATPNAATRKDYVDALVGSYVALTGSTMTGSLFAPYLFLTSPQYDYGSAAVRLDWARSTFLGNSGDQGLNNGALYIQKNDQYCIRMRSATEAPLIDFVNNAFSEQYGFIQFSSLQSRFTGRGGALDFNHPSIGDSYLTAHSGLTVTSSGGWFRFNSSTGYSLQLGGTEYIRFGGPGNGAQFMVGKMNTGNSYKGVEISPNGTVQCTTHDVWNVPVLMRQMNAANQDGQYYMQFLEHNGTEMARITRRTFPNGVHFQGATIGAPSDYRLKDDLGPVDSPLDRVMQLRPRHLRWKEGGGEFDGFLAHEVAPIVPDAVTGVKDEVYTNADEAERVGAKVGMIKAQQLEMAPIVPLLTAALQELAGRVTALEGAA